MDFLLVKEKDSPIKIALSDQTVYEIPDTLENKVPYSSEDKSDEDEWFCIENFSEKEFYPQDLVKGSFDSVSYEHASKINMDKVVYLVSYQEPNTWCFQRVLKRSFLCNKSLFHLGDNFEVEKSGNNIILADVPDAIYRQGEDCLYFKKLERISPIFPGIDQLYREATAEETKNFLEQSFIELVDDFDHQLVKKANRKRIAVAMEILEEFDSKQKKELLNYTADYYPGLNFRDGHFDIGSENDLKNLLYGLEQRLYTTPITQEKMCARSNRKLDSQG